MLAFALERWREEPETRVQDAYKWLFHATMGGEHAIADEEGPRRWMEEEWAGLAAPVAGERMVTELRADGLIVRVNLRPYRAAGGNKEALLAAFVASARLFKGDRADFLREWLALGEFLRKGAVGAMDRSAWEELDARAKEAGYPAIHHSPEYERAYVPAYRVVLARQAAACLPAGV